MFNLLQPVTTETTEGGETADSAIVEAQTTGEVTPANEVQAGEATSTDLAAPADSEEPSSSEIPLAEVAAESEEALLGKWLSSPRFPVAQPYDKSYHTV